MLVGRCPTPTVYCVATSFVEKLRGASGGTSRHKSRAFWESARNLANLGGSHPAQKALQRRVRSCSLRTERVTTKYEEHGSDDTNSTSYHRLQVEHAVETRALDVNSHKICILDTAHLIDLSVLG